MGTAAKQNSMFSQKPFKVAKCFSVWCAPRMQEGPLQREGQCSQFCQGHAVSKALSPGLTPSTDTPTDRQLDFVRSSSKLPKGNSPHPPALINTHLSYAQANVWKSFLSEAISCFSIIFLWIIFSLSLLGFVWVLFVLSSCLPLP